MVRKKDESHDYSCCLYPRNKKSYLPKRKKKKEKDKSVDWFVVGNKKCLYTKRLIDKVFLE